MKQRRERNQRGVHYLLIAYGQLDLSHNGEYWERENVTFWGLKKVFVSGMWRVEQSGDEPGWEERGQGPVYLQRHGALS